MIDVNGIQLHIAEQGQGPLVVLLHGFPESWHSWRHQFGPLAEAGFRVVAPDQRGYGGSDRPEDVSAYSILHLVGDVVGLIHALGEERAFVVGHDWGAPVAWHCALTRPDLFHAVFGLSVPFQPRRVKGPPTAAMAVLARRAGLGELYINQFQAPDAHRVFETDVPAALRKGFYAYDGATPPEKQSTGFIPEGENFISTVPADAPLPPWMTPAHFQEYVDAFSAGGFKGPLDWYRNLDRNWSLTAHLQDARIRVPAAFVVGERDPVRHYAGAHEAGLKDWAPDLRLQLVIPGAGHWIQQERPDEVNRLLLDFLGQVAT